MPSDGCRGLVVALEVLVILVVFPYEFQVFDSEPLVGQPLAQIPLGILLQLDGEPSVQSVEVQRLPDLIVLDLVQVVKIVNGLPRGREIEKRRFGKSLRRLHHSDVLVVRA